MSARNFTFGLRAVKCSHSSMGMAALVAVGDSYPNLEAATSAAIKASAQTRKRLEADFAKLGT